MKVLLFLIQTFVDIVHVTVHVLINVPQEKFLE